MRRWTWALIPLLAAGAGVLGSCSVLGCDEDRRVVEVEYGDWYDFGIGLVDALERKGYDCQSEGSIRDFRGNAIGTRYVCTGCK